MASNGLSGFMLGLLGAGEALSTGVQTYEQKKEREQKSKIQQASETRADEEMSLERQKIADLENPNSAENILKRAETGRVTAETNEVNERSKLIDKQIASKDQSVSSKDTQNLRSMYDALTKKSQSVPLSDDEKSELNAVTGELNNRLKVNPKSAPAAAAPNSDGFSLMKFIMGGGDETPPAQAPDQSLWKKYDQ